MSGVYLTLWDEAQRHNSPVLKPTKGGWPHITLAWTGKELDPGELGQLATRCFSEWTLRPVTLNRAIVTSFEEPQGVMQHRVLITLHDQDADAVRATRGRYLAPYHNSDRFAMRDPHISHSIHMTLADAQNTARLLNEEFLPYVVKVTGVCIN
jgi:hypothetical protein